MTYLGIPYAQAPVRWKNPQALTAAPWTGTFAATQYGNVCPQPLGSPPPTSCPGTSCPNPLPSCSFWEKHYKPAGQKKMLQRMAKAIQSKKAMK